MDWIDQNLDAYRVIAEILTDLRPLVRERIETKHGKEWFRDGIPEEVFERLIRNKEEEASIDWYENRYQEVISYAVFPDLFEIIIANSDLFTPILKLAPSQSLLSTRFLELEVMRSKIGRARQVSEAEINVLTSFHLRFRRAMQELKATAAGTAAPKADPASATDNAATKTAKTPADTTTKDIDWPKPTSTAEEAPKTDVGDEETKVAERSEAPGRPPQRLASPAAEESETTTTVDADVDDTEESGDEADESTGNGEPKTRETASAIVQRAMENNDDPAVLREVYREVTGIAEVIWTTDEIPTTAIWDRVSTNVWYEASFSSLELRPLSDFYELISQVRAKRQTGASKAEIQSFLNDSRFATTLLALRDMFQRNQL